MRVEGIAQDIASKEISGKVGADDTAVNDMSEAARSVLACQRRARQFQHLLPIFCSDWVASSTGI